MTPAAFASRAAPPSGQPAGRGRAAGASGGPAPLERRLVAAPAACAFLGIAPRTLRSWVALARVPVVRIGRTVRFDVRDLEALVEAAKRGALP